MIELIALRLVIELSSFATSLIYLAIESQSARVRIWPASCEATVHRGNCNMQQGFNMRSFLVLALAVTAFTATMTIETTSANAVICAAGVNRAGCAGPRGTAVVVKPPPVATCPYVVVNGVRVRQCV
jgi:hypothetical protein